MKNLYKYTLALLIFGLLNLGLSPDGFAGNKDRAGQAGAGELLINPWARSSGWGSVSVATVHGLESMFCNVAGIAFTEKTELVFSHSNWLQNADIDLNSFGLTTRVSDEAVIGLSIFSMNFGEVMITTVDNPEGTGATYEPSLLNVAVSYAKAFSSTIYGGMTFRVISESIKDASAQGVSIDAGIQYITGEKENIKFGITLKNVGPRMKFSGDGISLKSIIPGRSDDLEFTLNQRSAEFELPTTLNIGLGYDFLFENSSRFTLAGNFASNSFTKDQITLGGEYSLRNYVMLRAGYTYEEGIFEGIENEDRSNAHKGPSAGITVQVPLNKEKGSIFSVDYSFRATDHFNNTHTIGAKISF
jgi:hypothetical protein